MWNRPDVDFIASQDLPWSSVPAGLFGADHGGGLRKTLSVDEEDGARTDLIAFTNRQRGVLRHSCDFFVLAGRGMVNDQPYAPGTYLYAEAMTELDWVPGPGRTVLFFGPHGSPEFEPGQGSGKLTVLQESRDEWTSMSWRGDEPQPADVKIRWLRRDDTGIVFLVGMLPGYRAPMEEKHPVYEESFKIAGDLLLGRRGVVKPGGYFFRSPETWHGPLYSRTGNLSLIRKNAHGSTDYRDPLPGCDLETLIPACYDSDPSLHPSLLGGLMPAPPEPPRLPPAAGDHPGRRGYTVVPRDRARTDRRSWSVRPALPAIRADGGTSHPGNELIWGPPGHRRNVGTLPWSVATTPG